MASLLGCKCETCKGNISEIHQGIKCVKCFKTYHPRCRGFSAKDRQEIQKIATIWHCCQSRSPSRVAETTPTQIITTTETPIGTINSPLTPLKSSSKHTTAADGFQRLEALMIDMKKSLLSELSELRDKITSLAQENTSLKHELQTAQEVNVKLQETVVRLESDVLYLQEKENNNNIIISGIPDRNKNPLTVTLDILKLINAHITIEQIDSTQYIGKAAPQLEQNNKTIHSPQNFILVKLTSNRAKQEILDKKKVFKNLFSDQIGYRSDTIKPIVLRDHLTVRQLELFRAVRQFKPSNEFQFLWTTNNRILLRKTPQSRVIHIRNLNDLEKLQN